MFIGKDSNESTKKTFTVTGTIRNEETGKAEPNIYIKVRNKNINATTDLDGNYTLQLPRGTNVIEIKSLSHKDVTKTVVVYNDGNLDININ